MRRIFTAFFMLSSLLFAQYTTPGTGVNWNLDSLVTYSSGVVTFAANIYSVNALVTVAAADKISVPAGSKVMFTATAAGFEINGVFSAVGTDSNRITFASPTTDSLGAYQGFRFNDSSVDTLCRIAYCNILYAYYGFRTVDASPSFDHNYLFKCRRGVQLSGSNAYIGHCIIARSYEYGITMTLASSPVVEYNDLYDNNTQNTSPKNQISIGTQGANSPIVRHNRIHGSVNTKTGGISISALLGSSAAQIYNNEIFNNSYGIALSGSSITAVVMNNVIYNNNINSDANTSGSGINVSGTSTNTPYIAKNFIANNLWGITVQNGTSIVAGPQPYIGNAGSTNPLEQGMNVFRNNNHGGRIYDLYNNCTNDIYAQMNDWGVYDSASIEERVFHKRDSSIAGTVFFMPFSQSLLVRVINPNGGEIMRIGSTREISWTALTVRKVKIEYTTNSGANWLSVVDSVAAAPGVYSWIVPNTPSTQCLVKITDVDNPLTFDKSDSVFTITSQLCRDVSLAAGWNLVSVPLHAADMNASVLFPGINPAFAYAYNNGYIQMNVLANGTGYWVKSPAQSTVSICGTPAALNSIPVTQGWNMIGPYNAGLTVSALTTTPANILTSVFYGFDNGYVQAGTLMPGKGYWVRASQAGVINIPQNAAKVSASQTGSQTGTAAIRITDALNNSRSLYLSGSIPDNKYNALPPVPPAGVFDARFSSNELIGASENGPLTVVLNSAAYPVEMTVEGINITVTDLATNGKLLNQAVNAGGKIVIGDSRINMISIAAAALPKTFSLSQNYPNPFNPATTIKYHLSEAANTQLVVYDILGGEVVKLVNQRQNAGDYSVVFDAGRLNSGVYFYTLKSGKYSATRKLLLVK